MLDLLLPSLDRAIVRVLGESRPQPLERLLLRAPRVRTALSVMRMEPLDDETTLRLAAHWCEVGRAAAACRCATSPRAARPRSSRASTSPTSSQPGALLKLLRLTSERLREPGPPAPSPRSASTTCTRRWAC